MSEEHTPLPWEVQQGNFNPEDGGIGIIGSNLGGLVALATSSPVELDNKDDRRAKANAALIVRSVNAVPALVKALEDMFAAFDEPFRSKPMGAPGSHARAQQAEQIAAWDAGKAAIAAYRSGK